MLSTLLSNLGGLLKYQVRCTDWTASFFFGVYVLKSNNQKTEIFWWKSSNALNILPNWASSTLKN